jgi:hypothetical protein
MMKTSTRLFVSVLCGAVAGVAAVNAWSTDPVGYGEPISDVQSVRIADLLEHPEQYVDQRVKVEGLVDDVCPMKGCWLDIVDRQSRETIRFKVEDDVIVFPIEARGSDIVAEGVLRRQELSQRRAIAWLSHLADEKGEEFDPATVTGPMVFYRIEGNGALITAEG